MQEYFLGAFYMQIQNSSLFKSYLLNRKMQLPGELLSSRPKNSIDSILRDKTIKNQTELIQENYGQERSRSKFFRWDPRVTSQSQNIPIEDFTHQQQKIPKKKQAQRSIKDKVRIQYQQMQNVLKNQNHNLYQQNQFLLRQIYHLKKSNKKYKQKCLEQFMQLQCLKEECQTHKKRASTLESLFTQYSNVLQPKIQRKKSFIQSDLHKNHILEEISDTQSQTISSDR